MKRTAFNDNWTYNGQIISLPHDAMLHGRRSAEAPCGSAGAFFEGDSYLYEKRFDRPEGEHILLQFEGVYKNARVFLNGKEIGGARYGYIPFFVCADEALKDGENLLRVECECKDQPDSRWYSGAGIYRPVWLWTGSKNAIEPESVRISTVSVDPAVIRVQAQQEIDIEILDEEAVVATAQGSDVQIEIRDAKLWSDDSPSLYTLRARNGSDEITETFGIRKVEWSSKGLFVNGKNTLLRGGCLHHDNGILGAASYKESEFRRIRMMKDAGFNAIRSSHNPASPYLIEACDALGMYLIDEGWDMWFHHKSKFDYASDWREHHLDDLKAMVSRDFNHPSVIMYSIGNEVSEPAKDEGVEAIKEMVTYLHSADPNRAVTAGMNLLIISKSAGGKGVYSEDGAGRDDSNEKKTQGMNSTMFNMLTNLVGTGMNRAANSKRVDMITSPGLNLLDIAGYNYASGRYPLEGKAHPDRIIVGSETFPQDIAKNWEMVKEYPYLVGDFMWTSWDYLGEAGIGAWAYTDDGKGFNKPYPWLLADTGAFDILGDPNGELFHASAVWEKLKAPAICVQPINHSTKPAKAVWRGTNALPSWSWRDCDGKKAIVEVYCNADRVELFLNGESLGRKKVKLSKAAFKVKYKPGTLNAVAYDQNGREIGSSQLVSATGKPVIAILPEKETAKPDEVLYVNVSIVGKNGIVESNADRKLNITVEGGELLGFGSANPRTEERFHSGEYTTYYGRAQAVIKATGKEISITVTDGEETEKKTIKVI